MKKTLIVIILAFASVPLFAAEGFKDLDSAVASVTRGLERGDADLIVAGVGDRIMLQFSGLMDESGFFGRDQATLLLADLFGRVRPSGLEVISARKVSSKGQYHVTAAWKIRPADAEETREVYITLQDQDDTWMVASIRSSER